MEDEGIDFEIKFAPLRRYIPDICGIEQACEREYSWMRGLTEGNLDKLNYRRNGGLIMPVEHKDRIIAHADFEISVNNLDLLNLRVHPLYESQGVEQVMIERFIEKLSIDGRSQILTWIHEKEGKKATLFAQNGFEKVPKEKINDLFEIYDSFLPEVLEMIFKSPGAYLMRYELDS